MTIETIELSDFHKKISQREWAGWDSHGEVTSDGETECTGWTQTTSRHQK
jgi:hypothetical protein